MYAPAQTRSDGGIVMAGMGYMGQDGTEVQLPDETAWWDLHGQLAAANEELKSLEAMVRENPDVARTMGREITAARNTYTGYASQYARIYALAFGDAPAGLDGMGALGLDPATVAIIAATFIVLIGLVAAFYAYVMNDLAPRAEAERIAAQTRGTVAQGGVDLAAELRRQAAIAQANGDVAGARALLNQAAIAQQQAGEAAQPPRPDTDWSAWLQKNWMWVAVGVGLVLAAPNISKGVFGK